MAENPSWLERNIGILLGVCFAIVALELVLLGYFFDGMGFAGRTLWDWLDLLIVPAVIATGVYWLNRQERQAEREAEKRRAETERIRQEQRAQTEREIAAERERENVLQAYLDYMTELVLREGLRTSGPESEARHIARARTLTALHMLDGKRKGLLLRFLKESELMGAMRPAPPGSLRFTFHQAREGVIVQGQVVDLSYADLSYADLSGVNISGASLGLVNLAGANLVFANLNEADLSIADLSGVNMSFAELIGTDLSGAVLRDAKLIYTTLVRADLGYTDLRDADLRKANLYRANIRKAVLTEANLKGARLSETDLTEAQVANEQLANAGTLKGATLPDGNRYDGRFNLEGDIDYARWKGIDVDDPEAMARWYAGE